MENRLRGAGWTRRDVLRTLGVSGGNFSAVQAAEGATELARAGFDVQQIVASLPATLKWSSWVHRVAMPCL